MTIAKWLGGLCLSGLAMAPAESEAGCFTRMFQRPRAVCATAPASSYVVQYNGQFYIVPQGSTLLPSPAPQLPVAQAPVDPSFLVNQILGLQTQVQRLTTDTAEIRGVTIEVDGKVVKLTGDVGTLEDLVREILNRTPKPEGDAQADPGTGGAGADEGAKPGQLNTPEPNPNPNPNA